MSLKKDYLGKTFLNTKSNSYYVVTKVTQKKVHFETYSEGVGVPGSGTQDLGLFYSMVSNGTYKPVPTKKQKFTVSLRRTVYQFLDIEVEATSSEEAKNIGWDEAGNHLFPSEKSAEYDVMGVYPIEPFKPKSK